MFGSYSAFGQELDTASLECRLQLLANKQNMAITVENSTHLLLSYLLAIQTGHPMGSWRCYS